MSFLQVVVLGIIQGAAEFFPVSSTAHVMVFSRLMGFNHVDSILDRLLNVGTLLAVFIFFRKEVFILIDGGLNFLRNKKTKSRDFFIVVLYTTLPAMFICGTIELLFNYQIASIRTFAYVTVIFAIILYYCDRNNGSKTNINRRDSLLVGLAQVVAWIPGVSRLGSCMSMMRYLNYSREESFRYSIISSIMPITGACFIKLFKASNVNWEMVAIGNIASFIAGLISLNVAVIFFRKFTMNPIIIYRIILGLSILWWWY